MADQVTGIGIMSGSSLDGLDIAAVHFEYVRSNSGIHISAWQNRACQSLAFPPDLQSGLSDIGNASARSIGYYDAFLGRFIGESVVQFIAENDIKPDYIASHGHTVFHHPENQFGLQIGNASHIAYLTRLKTISDFRSADLAAGGTGAPLAPVSEHYLFKGHRYYLNLGGIANLSFHHDGHIMAWDVCPANQLLNHVAQSLGFAYDDAGKIAASGRDDPGLLEKLRMLLKVSAKKPFALDNSRLQEQFFPVIESSGLHARDKLSTINTYIATEIAGQLGQCQESLQTKATVFVTGGGAFNLDLIARIRRHCAQHGVDVLVPAPEIVNYKEAILIALLGLLRLEKAPNAFSSVTGATVDTINGAIYQPS